LCSIKILQKVARAAKEKETAMRNEEPGRYRPLNTDSYSYHRERREARRFKKGAKSFLLKFSAFFAFFCSIKILQKVAKEKQMGAGVGPES